MHARTHTHTHTEFITIIKLERKKYSSYVHEDTKTKLLKHMKWTTYSDHFRTSKINTIQTVLKNHSISNFFFFLISKANVRYLDRFIVLSSFSQASIAVSCTSHFFFYPPHTYVWTLMDILESYHLNLDSWQALFLNIFFCLWERGRERLGAIMSPVFFLGRCCRQTYSPQWRIMMIIYRYVERPFWQELIALYDY